MNLVVLADDGFSFLLAWELMSVSSWALVLAHHHDPNHRQAAYIYILMASFGTLALLLAFGLLAGGTGGYAFADIRTGGGTLPAVVLILALIGAGSKGRTGAPPRLAAARAPGRPQPCLRLDEAG
jgi:hydrogenase-4 component B